MFGSRYILCFFILGLAGETLVLVPPPPPAVVLAQTPHSSPPVRVCYVDYDSQSSIFERGSKSFKGNRTNLVFQAVAYKSGGDVQKMARNASNAGLGSIGHCYRGMHKWFEDDLVGNLFFHIRQLIIKRMSETWPNRYTINKIMR